MFLCVFVCIIVGEIAVDSGTVESAAVFLFEFFFKSCKTQSTEDSHFKLHTYFGPVSQRLFADARSAVEFIRACLTDTSIEKISAVLDPLSNSGQLCSEEFGWNIKLTLDNNSTVNDEDLDWLESDDDDFMSARGFNMNYSGVNQQAEPPVKVKAVDMVDMTSLKQQKTSGRAWLYEEVASYFSTESSEPETCVDVLVSTVFDILCSSKSNEQLQTEVHSSENMP